MVITPTDFLPAMLPSTRRLSEIIASMPVECAIFEKADPEFISAAMCKSLCEMQSDVSFDITFSEAGLVLMRRGFPVSSIRAFYPIAWQAFEEFRALRRLAKVAT